MRNYIIASVVALSLGVSSGYVAASTRDLSTSSQNTVLAAVYYTEPYQYDYYDYSPGFSYYGSPYYDTYSYPGVGITWGNGGHWFGHGGGYWHGRNVHR